MTYEEALNAEVTQAEAREEIRIHRLHFEDFAEEYGYRDTYRGKDVLGWIGY